MAKKISDSRLIRVTLIILFSLFCLKLISIGMIGWLTKIIESIDGSEVAKIQALSSFIPALEIKVGTPTMVILTALTARYGAREATANLKKEGTKGE